MTRDRSLDEFLPAGDEGSDPEEPEPEEADGDDDIEPAAPTYEWSPDGRPCGSCGEAVEERWRDGDAMVCADCKEW